MIERYWIVPLALLAVPALAAQPIRDWPCDLPLAEHFDPEAVWGGALPAALPDEWRGDPTIEELVAYSANPENSPRLGSQRIAAFADTLDDDPTAALLRVYAGLLEETDVLRGFLIDGVRDFIVRAKILDASVERHEQQLAALPADADETTREGFHQALFWDERNLDDALDEAEFLCHRYAYLDKKLRRLTAAIREAL